MKTVFQQPDKRVAFAAADVFLRINGWRLQRTTMQIHAEMIQMFTSGTFDIAHLDPWLGMYAGIPDFSGWAQRNSEPT